jgi:Fe2+ transport system protein FeoA
MSLAMLLPGCRAKVRALCGGREFNRRLASMGILPGVELVLLRCGLSGPVIVEVRGSQFILGRGMAQRIMVERLS